MQKVIELLGKIQGVIELLRKIQGVISLNAGSEYIKSANVMLGDIYAAVKEFQTYLASFHKEWKGAMLEIPIGKALVARHVDKAECGGCAVIAVRNAGCYCPMVCEYWRRDDGKNVTFELVDYPETGEK